MSDHPPITCNNYGDYNVPRLWEILSNEDDKQGWSQVTTWDNLVTAVKAQRDRLNKSISNLETKWPPGESQASAEFVKHLRELVAHMEKTMQDASSTRAGLNGIMSALATAKREMEPLHKEYQKKSSDWKLRSWDNAEDELNEKAWGVMAKADRAVESHVPQLRPSEPFTINPRDPGDPVGPRTGPRGGGGSGFSGGGEAVVPPIQHSPPPPLSGAGIAGPDGSGAGGSGAAVGAVPGGGSGGLDLAGAPPGGGGPIIGDPGLPGNPPGGPGLPGVPGPGTGGGGPGGGVGPFAMPAVNTAMPPGGLIPPAGGPARGSRGSSARQTGAPRAMPPGGVIGGAPMVGQGGRRTSGAAGRGTGRAGAGMMPLAGAPGRRGSDDPDETLAHGDPDNPWEVAEGVPPVIGPAEGDQRYDPGPGVIGMGA